MTVSTAYDRLLKPITLDEAHAEPEADSLFIEPTESGHPRIVIQTTIEVEGHTLTVTFNDTPIAEVLNILRRQARPTPCKTRRPKRRYEAVWSVFDFDDAPDADPRGAAVVATATQLLELGRAAGWSNALELASADIPYDLQ